MRPLSPHGGDPVAVVGNGPVGQTTALLLARWGVPVLLLDQRPARDAAGSRAICQQRDVLDVWASLGAGRIAEEGLTWTTARTFYREHELFAWSFVDRGRSPLPPFVNISQCRTEQVLDERIAEQPLIDVRWSHEVTGIAQDDSGVTLTCATDRGEVQLRACYAVACAGARGHSVRRALGLEFEGRSFEDRFLICDIRAELPGWESERRFYFDPAWNPDRQVLIHPCPDSTYRIDWQVPADFDLAAEEAGGALDARIRMIVGDRPYEIVWRSVYRFHSRLVPRMRVGRVVLAGDCAHVVAPFGARGLNSGVADAENAAWKLAFVLRGWAPETLLDSYHTERLAAAVENIEVTSATMRFLVPRGEAEWRARRALLDAAVAAPDERSTVDSGRFAEPFWYVDSPLTTPSATRPFPGRPPRGHAPPAVPGVLVPDAPVSAPGASRLRELVRDGFLVLTTEGVDPAATAGALEGAVSAPLRVVRLADIDRAGTVAEVLDARPREAWVIRPDGHIAAVLSEPTPGDLGAAVRRALGSARHDGENVPTSGGAGSSARPSDGVISEAPG
ncbi:3-(3-hydroxy-phenyl)propionate hydroxylase [Streptoalloteichus tenebrarius]|uniref:3-(3-hydroxy-phenyl)propionate hydroxylase n=1 Tax=Streptoalloteichus tenebrarius (strain ATCC 17920 / DSM 40477 / JCM 4838 / CBS 697.72 / NBRC 16177 / NCIMB 11028 / NRRL B-12390 / A12253. 1 / ISP 5477) TaxID=1933 RepID=A0ABT1HLM2_STRSD|nr:FAD-dependent monooxygenase [Streptoalloteichus tenebrarius]MCP2256411.1 3-(3-hydroxy-phenyl)propionate hydroxylase [Streptoalloteichus tenebrarius]BFF04760.1 FAD-dependent oxidoreductase [Streptoalloteichus tenebrarius]